MLTKKMCNKKEPLKLLLYYCAGTAYCQKSGKCSRTSHSRDFYCKMTCEGEPMTPSLSIPIVTGSSGIIPSANFNNFLENKKTPQRMLFYLG